MVEINMSPRPTALHAWRRERRKQCRRRHASPGSVSTAEWSLAVTDDGWGEEGRERGADRTGRDVSAERYPSVTGRTAAANDSDVTVTAVATL